MKQFSTKTCVPCCTLYRELPPITQTWSAWSASSVSSSLRADVKSAARWWAPAGGALESNTYITCLLKQHNTDTNQYLALTQHFIFQYSAPAATFLKASLQCSVLFNIKLHPCSDFFPPFLFQAQFLNRCKSCRLIM